jgi:hypothetical protein
MLTVRREGGERTDEVQALQRDKTEIGFQARPEQESGPRPLRNLQGPQAVRRKKLPSLA